MRVYFHKGFNSINLMNRRHISLDEIIGTEVRSLISATHFVRLLSHHLTDIFCNWNNKMKVFYFITVRYKIDKNSISLVV